MREEWKYVLMECGGQCVLITGTCMMLLWRVVNLVTRLQVQWSIDVHTFRQEYAYSLQVYICTAVHMVQGLPVWLNNLDCIGTEQQLLDCPVINIRNGISYCTHYNDAAAQCAGEKDISVPAC